MAARSSLLAWRIPRTEEPGWGAPVHGVAQSRTRLRRLSTHTQLTQHPGRSCPPGARAQPRVPLPLSLPPPASALALDSAALRDPRRRGHHRPSHSPLTFGLCHMLARTTLGPPGGASPSATPQHARQGFRGLQEPPPPILSLWVRTRPSSEHVHAAFMKPVTE